MNPLDHFPQWPRQPEFERSLATATLPSASGDAAPEWSRSLVLVWPVWFSQLKSKIDMSLSDADKFALGEARAWLMLGDAVSALRELSRIPSSQQNEPDVLKVAWDARAKLGDWDAAFRIAESLLASIPEDVHGWIIRAYAARRMKNGGLETAWALLHPALDKFPKVFLVPYNLACYAAQLGRADEAWQLLKRAMAVGGRATVLEMAKADPDLQPLRKRLANEDADS